MIGLEAKAMYVIQGRTAPHSGRFETLHHLGRFATLEEAQGHYDGYPTALRNMRRIAEERTVTRYRAVKCPPLENGTTERG